VSWPHQLPRLEAQRANDAIIAYHVIDKSTHTCMHAYIVATNHPCTMDAQVPMSSPDRQHKTNVKHQIVSVKQAVKLCQCSSDCHTFLKGVTNVVQQKGNRVLVLDSAHQEARTIGTCRSRLSAVTVARYCTICCHLALCSMLSNPAGCISSLAESSPLSAAITSKICGFSAT